MEIKDLDVAKIDKRLDNIESKDSSKRPRNFRDAMLCNENGDTSFLCLGGRLLQGMRV